MPTTGDLGLTWDEPAYRYSQMVSAQWWGRSPRARSADELTAVLDPDTLLYFWPYGRHGINFHPPLSGQLSLLTFAAFGDWVKDIPARRLASVFEYVITITVLYHFLASAIWHLGRPDRRRCAADDAPGLRPRPHRRHRHAGHDALDVGGRRRRGRG